ncbi:MAG TPA: PHP domain-containing protein, partial [Gammaproteobacteria bacterium]|nr:PHP domain-containing protein [Gammaproteobacteria bacterium]
MNNAKLAEILYKIADQLEEEENNPYRIRAYRRAAKSIKIYSKNVEQLVKSQEDLTIISHVGEKLAGKIKQIILEGTQSIHQKKRKTLIYKRDTFKPFIFRIYSIQPLAEKIIAKLKKIPFIQEFQCTGDFRRKKEIIQDLIIVISTQNKLKTLERFYRIPYIKSILKKSTNMTTVELKKGIPLTLYFVDQKTIGGKVIQTTGSHLHVEQLKEIAAKHHLKLNDKGLYKKNKKIAAYSEKEIYEHLNLQYIPPELREGTGEVTAASLHSLPQLIQLKDIRGDLHSHTNETDGSYTLEEMVAAAKQYHYEYLAITDHSQSLKITRGMDAKRLFMQIKKID